jgi:hypothetical protein
MIFIHPILLSVSIMMSLNRVTGFSLVPSIRRIIVDAYPFSVPTSLFSSANYPVTNFQRGDKIQVEVVRFGRLGASVQVIGHGSHDESDLISETDEPLADGLILQREIQYFRAARDGLDVILGEILPAYVENIRHEDGKLDISLRVPGGKGKAEDLAKIVLEKLQASKTGMLAIGDKSSPEDINRILPGTSKASFKRAVASLYKQGLVQPGSETTRLTPNP